MNHVGFMYDMARTYIRLNTDYKQVRLKHVCYVCFFFFKKNFVVRNQL